MYPHSNRKPGNRVLPALAVSSSGRRSPYLTIKIPWRAADVSRPVRALTPISKRTLPMTNPMSSNRLALFACLAGLVSIVCFTLFNLDASWSNVIFGAPFFSLTLGLIALVLGILSRRANVPLLRINRACAWCGIICGCAMILAWLGIAVLILSITFGEPM